MLIMLISLYTSRVILNALGVDDFGIYNVVGGLISMFTILSGSFSAAISRFITYELGKNDSRKLNCIFCTSVNIQLLMSVVIVIVSELIGIWFLNNKLNISAERMAAANWVLQCSIGIFVLNLLNTPFQAEVIAHEHMGTFAIISIVDAISKLIIAYILPFIPLDKLKIYVVLLLFEALLIRLVYMIYCRRKFEECVYNFSFDKATFREIGHFAGWNFLGSAAGILNTQGVNMLMNIYFGVAVNAARGIAVQVDGAVRAFINSFTTAINPQITKSYSSGDLDYMYKLICRGSKYSSFLFLLLAVPLVLETPIILNLWLKNVPEYTIIFVRLVIFASFVDSILANSFWTAIMATGKIKAYQISVSLLGGVVFPISWFCYYLGCRPEVTYIVYIVIFIFVFGLRMLFVHKLTGMPIHYFFRDILARVVPVTLLGFSVPLVIICNMDSSLFRLFLTCFFSVFFSISLICTLGLTKGERKIVKEFVLKKIGMIYGK